MLTHGCAKPEVSFNLLSLVDIQDVALFCADQELLWTGVYVVFHRGTSKDFDSFVAVSIIKVMGELMLLDRGSGLTHIPPEDVAVGGG